MLMAEQEENNVDRRLAKALTRFSLLLLWKRDEDIKWQG